MPVILLITNERKYRRSNPWMYGMCQLHFGYVINAERKLEIDPIAALVVQEIYKMCYDWKTIKEIHGILQERQIVRSNGKPLHYNAARYILTNRVYIGWVQPFGRENRKCRSCYCIGRAFQRCSNWDSEKLSRSRKAYRRRRLFAHNKVLLRKMRYYDGSTGRHEQYWKGTPLLRLCPLEKAQVR